jgi:hypothetical protein
MKYAVEIGSSYIIFIKIGSGIQNFMGGGTHVHTQQTNGKQGDFISLLLIFQNNKHRIEVLFKAVDWVRLPQDRGQ